MIAAITINLASHFAMVDGRRVEGIAYNYGYGKRYGKHAPFPNSNKIQYTFKYSSSQGK